MNSWPRLDPICCDIFLRTQDEGRNKGKIGASLKMTAPGVVVVDYLHALSWI